MTNAKVELLSVFFYLCQSEEINYYKHLCVMENGKNCGLEANEVFIKSCSSSTETFYDYIIKGNGIVRRCSATNHSYHYFSYSVEEGITELGDECFSKGGVGSVSLPKSLRKIGNGCFTLSKIRSITLPEGLEEIGHKNFPSSLTDLIIPSSLTDFPIDNIAGCKKLGDISVNKESTSFRVIDGILYNYDVSEILFCPRTKSGSVIFPDTVKKIGDYCFYGCSKLKSIYIPSSVQEIGGMGFFIR